FASNCRNHTTGAVSTPIQAEASDFAVSSMSLLEIRIHVDQQVNRHPRRYDEIPIQSVDLNPEELLLLDSFGQNDQEHHHGLHRVRDGVHRVQTNHDPHERAVNVGAPLEAEAVELDQPDIQKQQRHQDIQGEVKDGLSAFPL